MVVVGLGKRGGRSCSSRDGPATIIWAVTSTNGVVLLMVV